MKQIETEIIMEATAELKKEIIDDLQVDDPSPEEANAILKKLSSNK